MAKCYFEIRKNAARGTDSIAADMMRHLHARQHLGKAVVVCDRPDIAFPAARKQWLKLARAVQKQRAGTLNADKILKYTHTIIHMQSMRFSYTTPLEDPEADVYFLTPTQLATAPVHCFTIYVLSPLHFDTALLLVDQLPADALIVDYDHTTEWLKIGLQSKQILEDQVATEWRQVLHFLEQRDIQISTLHNGQLHHVEAMDNALDMLLNTPHKFIRIATEFQHALELARPIRISKQLRMHHDALMLLAHRVQTLTSTAFSQRFLENYNEDDTFFLYDAKRRRFIFSGETFAEAIVRHTQAGRFNLVRAIQALA